MSRSAKNRSCKRRSRMVAVSAAVISQALLAQFRGSLAYASPKGAHVVHGSVVITQSGDETIIRASNHSVINFSSFDIAPGESVEIIEPSARSRVLERILGTAPTLIDGSLTSNGRVYIVNPNGIDFGASAQVNVGGLTAIAGQLSTADFLAGVDHFTNLSGPVSNEGQIQSSGRTVLAGAQVSNAGSITASGNAVVLAAGSDVYVGVSGSDIYAKVTPQSGSLAASVPGAGDIYSLALGAASHIQAEQIAVNGGGGNVQVSGTLDASTQTPGAAGGSVTVTGGNVQLTGATINASGAAGGGSIDIGGVPNGQGNVALARQVTVSADSTLQADATVNGNGGQIAVWSSQATNVAGQILARGAGSGAGGSADVSGLGALSFTGSANLSGPGGLGTFLMDPVTFTVAPSGGDETGAQLASSVASSSAGFVLSATSEIFIEDTVDIHTVPNTLTLEAPTIDLSAPILIFSPGQLSGVGVQTVDLHQGGLLQNGVDVLPASGGTLDVDSGFVSTEDVTIGKQITLVNLGGSNAANADQANSWTVSAPITLSGAFEANITGGAAFSFSSAVILSGNTGIFAPGGGDVVFSNTIDGPFNLEVNSGGQTEEFDGNVGSTTPLAGLTVDASGGSTTIAGNVSTTAGQTYGDAVTLTSGSAQTLEDGTGAITFSSTLSGAGTSLTVSGAGGDIFDDTVMVKSLDATGGNTTLSADVTTTAGQTYVDAVTLTGTTRTLTDSAGAISFSSTVTGTGTALTVSGAGGDIFGGTVTVQSLDAAGGNTILAADVTTTAGQTYVDGVTLTGLAQTLTDGAGAIAFSSTLTGTGTALTVSGAGGDIFDGTVFVQSLDATGGNTTLGADVTTTAGQTYVNAVTLTNGTQTLTDATGAITFSSTVTGTGTALTVSGVGGDIFDSAIVVKSLDVAAGNTTLGANVTTTAGQTYVDAVTLTALKQTLTDGTGAISFSSTVTGTGTALTVSGVGGDIFGATVTVQSLDAAGGPTTLSGDVTTTAGQTYVDAVQLYGNTQTLTDATGAITFSSTILGTATALTVSGAGGDIFEGAVFVNSLQTAGGTTILAADVTTLAGQTYNDAVTLIGSSRTLSDGVGAITFSATLTGTGTALTVSGAGGDIFEGTVNVQSLDAIGGNTTLGADVTTTAGQTYADAVTLTGAAQTLIDGTGAITFFSTVTGTQTDLTVSAAGGDNIFGTVNVQSLITGGGTATLGGDVTTTAGQTYLDAVTLTSGAHSLSDGTGAITFSSTLTGQFTDLTVSGAGGDIFDGTVVVESLNVTTGNTTLAADVTTTAGQDYVGAVTLIGGSRSLTDGTGAITFGSTLTGTGTALTVSGAGGDNFDGSVAVESLDATGGHINLGADVTTTAGQTYADAVSLFGATQTLTDGTGAITFSSTVVGSLTAVTISGEGGDIFDGMAIFLSLDATGGPVTLGGGVSTLGGGQTYANAVTLASGTELLQDTVSGAITFSSTLTGTGTALTVSGAGGDIFEGTVNVQSLYATGGAITLGADVTTTAGQTYADAVTLTGGARTLIDGTGAITFASTVTGTGTALTVSGMGGDIFDADVEVKSLDAAGGNTTLGANVTTTAGQTYADMVTLTGAAQTLTDGTGAIAFSSTLTGTGTALTVSGVGGDIFEGTVNVQSLDVNVGATTLSADVTTTAGQTYVEAVTLTNATQTLTDGTGAITFSSTLTGTGTALTVSGVGGDIFEGTVNVQSLDATGGNTTLGANVTTTAGQTYADAVTLTGVNQTLTDGTGAITFSSTLTGTTTALTVSGLGGDNFDGAVTVQSLVATGGDTTLGADVTTTAGQTYVDAVTLTGGARTLTDATGAITFSSTLTGTGTALTVSGVGGDVFDGTVTVQSLDVTGGATTLGADVTTTAGQTYVNAVTLTGLTRTLTDGTGAITFSSTLTGTGTALTVSGVGGDIFDGTVTVKSLDATGGNTTLGANVTTTAGQTYADMVTLTGGAQTLVDGTGAIAFSSTLTGTTTALTVSGIGGDIFDGTVTVESLNVTVGATTLGADVTTTAGQTYVSAVTLSGAARTLTDGTGAITFSSTLTGTGTALTVSGIGGDIFDGTVKVESFDATGGAITLGANVTTTAGQTYVEAVTLTGATQTLFDSTGAITFSSTVTGTGTALTVDGFGGDIFEGAVNVESLTLAGGGATLLGNVTTTAGQTYVDAVTLSSGSQTLNGGTGGITFSSTVTGTGTALTLSGTGGDVFDGTVTVESLDAMGGTTTLGANVTTTAGQTYVDAVTLTGTAQTLIDGTGAITFSSTVTGAGTALTVSGFGGEIFDGTVVVKSLDATGGNTTLGANVTTTAGQTYVDAVTLTGVAQTLKDSGNGTITFSSTLTGTTTALTVSAGGGEIFDGIVVVKSLDTTGGGTTLGADVTTTAGQTYADAVTVTGDQTLIDPTGAIVFSSTLIGPSTPLTVIGAGGDIFDGQVILQSLDTQGAGGTTLGGGVTTTAGQTYEDAVTLTGVNQTLIDGTGAIVFSSTIMGTGSALTVSGFGGDIFDGSITVKSLDATGGNTTLVGNVTTTAGQTYVDAVTLTSGAQTLTDATGAITFSSTLTGSGTALTVSGVGGDVFDGTVMVQSLNVTVGTTTLGADVTTTAGQTYVSAVTLSGAARTLSDGTGAITFSSTVTGAGTALTVIGVGGNIFDGTVKAKSLDAAGGATILGANVTTTAGQTYVDAVTLTGAAQTLIDGTGAIAFSTTVTGTGTALTVSGVGGDVFDGTIDVKSLDATGGNTILLGNVTTTAGQTYVDAVTLNSGPAQTLTDATGAITFSSTLTGTTTALTVSAGGGEIFDGIVVVKSLDTTGGGTTLGADVTTTAGQTYVDAVTLTGVTQTLIDGTGAITFSSTVTGAGSALTVSGFGGDIFDGTVSVKSLDATGGNTTLVANVTTTAGQTYVDAVTLTSAAQTLTDTGSGSIKFDTTLTGTTTALTVSAAGGETFDGLVVVKSLDTTGGGTTLAADVTTTAGQTYVDAVTLTGGARTLFDGTGAIAFSSTLTGTGTALTVSGSAGDIFDGTVKVLSLDAIGGNTTLGANVTTTAGQTYLDAVTLTGGTQTLTDGTGAIAFSSTVTGTGSALTVSGVGGDVFDGTIDVKSLDATGGNTTLVGNVTTTAGQTYVDAVTLTSGAQTLTDATGAIAFSSTLTGTGTALTVSGVGGDFFDGTVTVKSLDATGGATTLGANVTTTAGQTYVDAVTLTGAAQVLIDGTGAIIFSTTVTGTGTALTVSGIGGDIFDGTVNVKSLDATGGAITLGANVTTTAGQTYVDAVTLTGTTQSLFDSTGAITFSSTLTGTGTALTVDGFGGDIFDGAVDVESLTVAGGGTTLVGNVTTTAGQTYVDAVTLTSGAQTLNGGTGGITFSSTVTGTGTALTVTGTGGDVFDGTVTLESLDAMGGPTTLGANVTTTAGQTYVDAVTLTGASQTLIDGTGAITFSSTVTGTGTALTVSGFGGDIFDGTVDVKSLYATGGAITLGANVTTTAGQTYADAVTLTGIAQTLTDTGNGTITFSSTLTGTTTALTVSGAGGEIFDEVVVVESLDTTGGGTTLGADVTTTAGQTYADAVTVTGDQTLIDLTGAIVFSSTLTGPSTPLTVIGAGGDIFDGQVILLSLDTQGAGGTTLGGSVTTTAGQTYEDAVTLTGGAQTLTDSTGAIVFSSTLTGTGTALTVSGTGGNIFDGAVAVESLDVAAGETTVVSDVTTTAGQTYVEAVTLTSGAQTFTDGTGAITFSSTVTGTGTAMTVFGVGGDNFDGTVTVQSLDVTGGLTTIVADVTTTAGQTYADAVTLTSGSQTLVDGTGAIAFSSTLTGTGTALTVSGAGGDIFDSTVTLKSLDATGGATTIVANVTTTAGQTYADAVTLTSAAQTLIDGTGAITFSSTVTGTGTALTVSGVGGDIFDGTVDVKSLYATGGNTTLVGNVTTTAGQTYVDAVTLTSAAQTLTDGTGAITFSSTVTGTGTALTVSGVGGDIFDGTVTVQSLYATGGATTLVGNVTTTAGQTYDDAVTLTSATQTLIDGTGAITFSSTVTGTGTALTVSGVGGDIFDGNVTVQSLYATGGPTTLVANVTTTAGQTYADAVTLTSAAQTLIDGTGAITFSSTVTGTGTALTVSGLGGDIFDSTVMVQSLDVASGNTTLVGNVTTTAGQTYVDAVTLTSASQTLTDGTGAITFSSTVTGTSTALTVSGVGGNIFDGTVTVKSLDATGGATTIVANVTTTAGQTYADAVTLTNGTQTLTDATGAITFSSTVTGTGTALTVSGVGGDIFESTVDVKSLDATGGNTTLVGNVTTTAGQTYVDAVTLTSGAQTLTDATGAITFSSTVTGTGTALTVSGVGGDVFEGTVIVKSLDATGGNITLGANVTTTAGQTYVDAVTLTGATQTLTDSTGAITFSSTITGTGTALTVSGAGGDIFDGTVMVKSLDGMGGGTILIGNVTTTTGQTYLDAVTLTGPTQTLTDSVGAITFSSTVTGTGTALTVSGAGGDNFDGTVDVKSLDATGGNIVLGANVTTTAGQTYMDAVTLTGTIQTLIDGTGAITFRSTLTGTGSALTVSGAGGDIFDNNVSVKSLDATGGNTTLVSNVTTTAGQTYADAVTLTSGAQTLTDDAGAITFHSTLTGAGTALTVSGVGGDIFDGTVIVRSLDATGGATTLGANVTTTAGQTYVDAVTLTGAAQTLIDDAAAITFSSTLTGTGTALTVSGAGGDNFDDSVSVASLDATGGPITLGANVTTTAGQTYVDAVTLTGGAQTLTDGTGAITFSSTLTGTGTALTVSGLGGNTFDDTVNVESLDVAGGATTIVSDVTTTAGQTYADAVTLTSASQTFTDSNGAITFSSTLTGSSTALTVSGVGGDNFEGTVTVQSLDAIGGNTTLGADVSTTAGQTYVEAVTVTGDQTLVDPTGAIVFSSTLTGVNTPLTVDGAGGDVFDGDIDLKSLDTQGAGGTELDANVTTSAGQTYENHVTLSEPTITLTDTGGPIDFEDGLSGQGTSLTISGAGGNIFNGTTTLISINASGAGGTTVTGLLTTSNGQTYHDAVTLTAPGSDLFSPTTINFYDKISGAGRVEAFDIDTEGQVFTISTILFESHTASNLSEFTDQNFSLFGGGKSLELATVIAGAITFVPPQPVEAPPSLTPSERQDLLLLGIYVREASNNENILGNTTSGVVIVDWPPVHQPRPEDRKVTPVRLEAQRVKLIVAEVEDVVGKGFSRQKELTDLLSAGVGDYRAQIKPTDDKVAPGDFGRFIMTHQTAPNEKAIAQKLTEMRELALNIEGLGLSIAEAQGANQYWSASLTPDDEGLVDANGEFNPHWLLDVLNSLPAPGTQR